MNKHTVTKAIEEIKVLRKENERMAYRLKMFDDLMLLFRSGPNSAGMCLGEDVIFQLEKEIKEDEMGNASVASAIRKNF
jgi:hypothetical protein